VQLPFTGDDREIEVAVIAPDVLAEPTAEAHPPTARFADEAVARCVKVVEEVRVTATVDVALVRGLVSFTSTVEPDTDATDPLATANCPANLRYWLLFPEWGKWNSPPPAGAPEGADPLVVLPPNRKPPPPAPNPPVQPVEVGWEMVTSVAVTGLPRGDPLEDEDEDEVGFPVAMTHDPTVTLAAEPDTVWVKVVVGV
jgi:hypothetical protein